MKKVLALLFLLSVGFPTFAATSVKVGETTTLYCKATAPDGYITHAFFELADASDAQNLALYSHSSDCYATLTGLKPKNNITVNVTYAYTYMSYNNKRMVGHATYTEKVSVTGGGPLTSMAFVPNEKTIKVGESIKVRLEVKPANTSTGIDWGTGMYGQPFNFEISDVENRSFTVTAKKTGKLYLIAQSENNKMATCIITATQDGKKASVEPSTISLTSEKEELAEGDNVQLKYTLEPDGATSTITWESSNEKVATVNEYGKVTAVSAGKAEIKATTANNKTAKVEVEVLAPATGVTIPGSVDMYRGYYFQMSPTWTPSNSALSAAWKSSDTSVATVTNGKVYGRKTGTASITVTLKNGSTATCTITVLEPPTNLATYRVTSKISQIKNLARRTYDNKK